MRYEDERFKHIKSDKFEIEAEKLIASADQLDPSEFRQLLDKLAATNTEIAKEFIKKRITDGHPLIAHSALKKTIQLDLPLTFRELSEVLNYAEKRYRLHVDSRSLFYQRWLHDHETEMENLRKYACEILKETTDVTFFEYVFQELVSFHWQTEYELYKYWFSVYDYLIQTGNPVEVITITKKILKTTEPKITKPLKWDVEYELLHIVNVFIQLKKQAKDVVPMLIDTLVAILENYEQDISQTEIEEALNYLGFCSEDSIVEYGLISLLIDALFEIDVCKSLKILRKKLPLSDEKNDNLEMIVQHFKKKC